MRSFVSIETEAIILCFLARSEPLQAIKLSSITGEAAEEGLDSHVNDDINEANSQPIATRSPTLLPVPASRNDEYELTTCPAYVPTDVQSLEKEDGPYEVVINTKPNVPPPVPDSGNYEYELTALTNNIQIKKQRMDNMRL